MEYNDSILFVDLEVSKKEKIIEIGLVLDSETLHTNSLKTAADFISLHHDKIRFLCGHNLIDFDNGYLRQSSLDPLLSGIPCIDTLSVSMLLFSEKTFHKLPKTYKSEDNFRNNPLKDAKLTKKLYEKSVQKFLSLKKDLQNIFYTLASKNSKFTGFFESLPYIPEIIEPTKLLDMLIRHYEGIFIDRELLKTAIESRGVELAYIVALLTPIIEVKSHPPRILYEYPRLPDLHKRLTLKKESDEELTEFSAQTFGFAAFRAFPRLEASLVYGTTISQREIVEAALRGESFIAVLPTGGGKTFTFWLPALYRTRRTKALTVVISPLQALMQDHIESFNRQVANFTAVAISGYQNAMERSDAIDKVINGEADILYLAPESLRSETIFRMLKNRLIDRFVVDEAHCLSTWGHDFRHDYFFIAEFIQDLLAEQPWTERIPVSCFTATAKPDVIEDITRYFGEKLELKMERYLARPERTNLTYESLLVEKEEEKYLRLLEILNERSGPALIYIPTSTSKCDDIAERLATDISPRKVASFHARLESEHKSRILQEYLSGEIDIIVATTAFGMGVDKPDIQTVIHYEVSDSLENYAQEAGRGARDKALEALCPILFDEKDLDKHFNQLNRNKLSADEINAIFRVLKKRKSEKVILSVREIAEAAGWDTEGEDQSWEIKVKTSLLELEREGYLQRKRNKVRFYADAVAQDALDKLHELKEKNTIDETRHTELSRVLQLLLGRGKPAPFQVDEAAFLLDWDREKLGLAVLQLKEHGIISDAKEMTLKIRPDAEKKLEKVLQIEMALFKRFKNDTHGTITIRALNEGLIEAGVLKEGENYTETIRELLKLWQHKSGRFHFRRTDRQNDLWHYELRDEENIRKALTIKHNMARSLIRHFLTGIPKSHFKEPVSVEFSILNLQKELGHPANWIDKALLYLHRLKILELGEGRFIYYAPMQIYKTDKFDKKLRYTKIEYAKRLKAYYTRKIEAIHIMGEYARRMRSDPKGAKAFLSDYFTMGYDKFKRHYKLLKEQISRPMTLHRYEKIFGSLSDAQQRIIEDNQHDAIQVLAGPGSGKTMVLVHKIASLILKEDVKPEQFLMLTFSHAAAAEFRNRLYELIGMTAKEVEIRTFHGYALALIGRQIGEGKEELLQNVVAVAAKQIQDGLVHPQLKSVLMLDEFQDINADAFDLIEALYDAQDGAMRLIAVGDDDQCIMESVNGADVRYFEHFIERFGQGEGSHARYALLDNYRSRRPVLRVASTLLEHLRTRIKTDVPKATRDKGPKVELIEIPRGDLIGGAIARYAKILDKESSTAFLAHTNKEVTALYSALYAHGLRPAYLAERAGYRLKNLAEIRHFTLSLRSIAGDDPMFDRTQISRARADTRRYFPASKRLETLEKVIDSFTKEYESFYFTLWENYLNEIDFDEFESFGYLLVSTMHKSKGKEFDRVVITIPAKPLNDEWLRLLYVAMTRAKTDLHVVTNDQKLIGILKKADSFLSKTLAYRTDTTVYPPPATQTHIMSLRDVALSYSYYSSLSPASRPVSGSLCTLQTGSFPYHLLYKNRRVERLSKAFSQTLRERIEKGWQVREIETDSVVHWYDTEKEAEFMHVLAKIVINS